MPLLANAGNVSRREMQARVRQEYEAYRDHVMRDEQLNDEEFAHRLQQAGDKLLPSGRRQRTGYMAG